MYRDQNKKKAHLTSRHFSGAAFAFSSIDRSKSKGQQTITYSYPTDNKKNDILDHTAIEPKIGNMTDFEELVKKAHEKGMKVVVDFIPNHTSKEHKWFIESAMKTDSKKRDWYIWRKTASNWPSVTGGKAWTEDSTTNEFYLHQFEESKPDLNLRNEKVVEALNKVLKFWIDKGVDGFRALDVQYLLEDESFADEKVKPNYNESDLSYDMTEHSKTFDLPGNVDLVKKFREFLNQEDSHKLLILDLKGSGDQVKQFAKISDIPTYSGLVDLKKSDGIPAKVNKSVTEYLASLSKDQTPNFVVSTPESSVADRLGGSLVNAMNVLLLTLPGIPSTSFGQELGLTNGGNYQTELNKQKNDTKSSYSLFMAAAKLRKDKAFDTTTDFRAVHVDKQILAYVRGDKYLVAINFDDKAADKDNINGLSGNGEVVLDSEFILNGKTKDVNQIHLNKGQVVVVKLGKHTYL